MANLRNIQRQRQRRRGWGHTTPPIGWGHTTPPIKNWVPPRLAEPIAAKIVFGITEILENILLYLGMADLLLSVSRVSRMWYNVVNTAPSIRRILHFDPAPAQPAFIKPVTKHRGLLSGPLITRFISLCRWRKINLATEVFSNSSNGGTLETFLSRLLSTYRTIGYLPDRSYRVRHQLAKDYRQRFEIPGASWRRMLVSQPPPAWVYCVWGEVPADHEEDTRVLTRVDTPDTSGLRMGQLYDFVQSMRNNGVDKSCYEFTVHVNEPECPAWLRFANMVTEQLAVDIGGSAGIFIEAEGRLSCGDCLRATMDRPYRRVTFDYRALFRCQNILDDEDDEDEEGEEDDEDDDDPGSLEIEGTLPTTSLANAAPGSCDSNLPRPGRGLRDLY